MSLRFFQRIKIMRGVTLNLSKSGVSTSFGPRGLKYTVGHGKRRTTVGLPGSGLFYTTVRSAQKSSKPREQHRGPSLRATILLVALAALMWFAVPASAVYKCVENGKTVYSDRPCPTTATTAAAPNLTNSARFGSYAGGANFDTRPLPPMDFGNTPAQVVSKAGGVVSSILVDARDCEWALKVTKDAAKCATFLQQMIEGREFTQAMGALSEAAGAADGASMQHLQRLTREAAEIVRIKDFAMHRIGR